MRTYNQVEDEETKTVEEEIVEKAVPEETETIEDDDLDEVV